MLPLTKLDTNDSLTEQVAMGKFFSHRKVSRPDAYRDRRGGVR